jgi:hypothetical protein
LLRACRDGCCRTTFVAGTSSTGSGSGSAFDLLSRSNPLRFSLPFAVLAAFIVPFVDAVALDFRCSWLTAGAPLLALAPAAGFALLDFAAVDVFVPPEDLPPAEALAPAGAFGFGPVLPETRVLTAPAAPAAATAGTGGAQLRNMMNCWHSVHKLVVTQ